MKYLVVILGINIILIILGMNYRWNLEEFSEIVILKLDYWKSVLVSKDCMQSWAQNTFLYLNTKYMLKMYLNTKYFLQMYLNTKYIDVFKYFLNTFVNTFLYYFQIIVLIHSIHYKFENERNIRHKISSIILYVNNIADMHVIYYITCW